MLKGAGEFIRPPLFYKNLSSVFADSPKSNFKLDNTCHHLIIIIATNYKLRLKGNMPKFIHQKAFTLIEVLLAVFIFTVGVGSSLLLFSHAMVSADYAKDLTVATSHGEYILEEMQTLKTLADVTSRNWDSWAKEEGVNTLPDETVKVTFSDELENPIGVQVAVSWTKKLRTNTIKLATKLAK